MTSQGDVDKEGTLVIQQAQGPKTPRPITVHFKKKSELFSIGGGHVVPVVNNTTCFSKYKWLLFLLLFSYFRLLSHSFLK